MSEKLVLPALAYAQDALAPVISVSTMERHYGKHHNAYVVKGNQLIEGTPLANASLEEIVKDAAKTGNKPLFNNAAQVWNHNRYWESLSPNGGTPSDALAAAIDRDLGGLAMLKEDIVKKGVGHFASGWVWLTKKDGKLHLIDTHDADCALMHDHAPLLVLDVWEHAYYLDYQNERERHLRTVANDLLNWTGASERFAAA
jgi:Fe-Mn family superoxide dismutase